MTAYVPAEVILAFACTGAVLVVLLLMYAGYFSVRFLTRRTKARSTPVSEARTATVASSPRLTPAPLTGATAPRPETVLPETSAPEPLAPTELPETGPGIGVMAFYKPGPPTQPATPRARVLRPRGQARDASPQS